MNILKPYFKMHKSRLNCFSQILIALFTVRTVNLVELAQAVVCGNSEGARYMRITVKSNANFGLKANTGFTFIRTLISVLFEQSNKGHISKALFMNQRFSARGF
jgi:hypothetical protein